MEKIFLRFKRKTVKRNPSLFEMRKKCFKCHKIKRLGLFYEHPQMLDGHLNKCKNCTKKDMKNPAYAERKRSYDKLRFHHPKRKLWRMKQQRKNRGLFPGKNKARQAVLREIKTGRLVRQPCEACGNKSEAHHPDYRKPLLVNWLCQRHHRELHNKQKI